MIRFCSPRLRAPAGVAAINCTSVSTDEWRCLSPMLADAEPLELHGYRSWTVENIWQYSKVYECHTDYAGWHAWRLAGYANQRGVRYPMGKGAVPQYSWLTRSLGKMDVVAARQHIYVPAYEQKILRFHSDALDRLVSMAAAGDIWIWDFDVYEPPDRSGGFAAVLADPVVSLGHGFVLAKLICDRAGIDYWNI